MCTLEYYLKIFIFQVVSAEQKMIVIQCFKPEDQCELNTTTVRSGCIFLSTYDCMYIIIMTLS